MCQEFRDYLQARENRDKLDEKYIGFEVAPVIQPFFSSFFPHWCYIEVSRLHKLIDSAYSPV